MIGDFVDAVIGDVGDRDSGARRRVHVDVVNADPIPGDDSAAAFSGRRNDVRSYRRVTHKQRGRLASKLNERILVRGRRDDELYAQWLEDLPFDLEARKRVISDDDAV